jgi:flagellar hook-length control protein FliK
LVQVRILRRIVSVSVGFSSVPAGAAPSLTSDATASASGASGDGSLFAQLLALLGGDNAGTPNDGAATDLAGLVGNVINQVSGGSNVAAAVAPTLSVPAETDPASALPANLDAIAATAKTLDTTGGKSLLKSLADALTALNDSLEAGDSPDAKQLKSVDDLASTLAGLLAQAQPALAAAAPEVASTDGASITGVDATAGPSGAADLADTLKDLIAALAPAAAPATNGAAEIADATTPTTTPATDAPDLDPVMAQLAEVLDQVATKLSDKAPALAEKLTALGDTLESGKITPQVMDALGLAKDAVAEITDLAQRIAQPKPAAPKAASDAVAFTPPSLALPEVARETAKSADSDTTAAPPTTPATTDTASGTDRAASLEAKPVDAKTIDRATETAPKAKPEAEPAADAATKPAADTPDGNGLVAPNQAQNQANVPAAAVARTAQGAYQSQALVPSLPQVAFEIARHVESGTKRFQIRLDPPELGRIDVRLSVDNSGTVQARMTVERAETLDLMQRDQRSLQQALQQAGLDISKTNLEFSLGQNGFGRNGQSFSGWGDGNSAAADTATTTTSEPTTTPVEIYRGTASQRGLNLFV